MFYSVGSGGSNALTVLRVRGKGGYMFIEGGPLVKGGGVLNIPKKKGGWGS